VLALHIVGSRDVAAGQAPGVNGGRLVGSWALRSGNTVDAYLVGGLDGAGALRCEWDSWPLTLAEQAEWVSRVRPAIITRLGELLERPGAAIVIPL
jgi:hypothetical protein